MYGVAWHGMELSPPIPIPMTNDPDTDADTVSDWFGVNEKIYDDGFFNRNCNLYDIFIFINVRDLDWIGD